MTDDVASKTMNQDDRHYNDQWLNAFADGELAADQHRELELHLTQCAACHARLADIESVFVALADVADVPLERELAPSVLSRIAQADASTSAEVPALIKWALVPQVLAAVALLAFAIPALATDSAAVGNLANLMTGSADGLLDALRAANSALPELGHELELLASDPSPLGGLLQFAPSSILGEQLASMQTMEWAMVASIAFLLLLAGNWAVLTAAASNRPGGNGHT